MAITILTVYEQFLLQTGLITLGLILALYVIIASEFKKYVLNKRIHKFEISRKELSKLLEKAKEDIQALSSAEYDKVTEKRIEMEQYEKLPGWMTWGVLIDIILLSITALLPILVIIAPILIPYQDAITVLSQIALFFGILLFIIICFIVFAESKDLLSGEFEEMIENSKKVFKEIEDSKKKDSIDSNKPTIKEKKKKQEEFKELVEKFLTEKVEDETFIEKWKNKHPPN